MWSQIYRAASSALRKHPDLRYYLPRPLYRMLAVLVLSRARLGSDRQYLTESILPILASEKVNRVLFVGCKSYTAHYGKQFARAAIEYWTTDIDPVAAIWGEKGHHIIYDIKKIDEVCPARWFDVILLNGVFGYGVDEEGDMNQAVEAIARVLRCNGALLIGWNTTKIKDPTELKATRMYFHRSDVLPLPSRQVFTDTDHIYDWMVKTGAA